MKPMMVFHSAAVDGSSVGSHDAGTNLDMAAFAVEDLKCITASETTVELMFDETGMFNANAGASAGGEDLTGTDVSIGLENSLVQLTTTDAATTTKVIKDIVLAINGGPHKSGMLLFDAVNDVYPGDIASGDVSAINIRRTTTSRLIAKA
jgi:hypothetical protein